MAITLVQYVHNTGVNGSNPSVTFASTGAGHLLVAFVSSGQNTGNPTFATPSGWTAESELTQNGYSNRNGQAFYYVNNPGALTAVTFTASGASPTGWVVEAYEFSGVATSSALDVESQSAPAAYSTTSTQSVTTTVDGDLVIGWAAANAAHGGASISGPSSGGWTNEAELSDANGFENDITGYVVQATHGAISYTVTSTATTDWMAVTIAFKAAGGGSIVSGSATLAANATIAQSAQVVAPSGADPLAANAILAATPGANVLATAPLASNAALVVTGAIVVSASAPLPANAAIAASAQIVAHGDALAGNATLAASAQLVTNAAVAQANAALATPNGAIVVEPTAPLQANAVLAATGGEIGQNLLVANAALVVSAQIVPAVAPLTANSVLSEAAQIVAAAFALQANAVLAATGTASPPSQPGIVTASDRTLTTVGAADARLTSGTASDAASALVTAKDQV